VDTSTPEPRMCNVAAKGDPVLVEVPASSSGRACSASKRTGRARVSLAQENVRRTSWPPGSYAQMRPVKTAAISMDNRNQCWALGSVIIGRCESELASETLDVAGCSSSRCRSRFFLPTSLCA